MANEKQINSRIQMKHDTEANWISAGNATKPFVPKQGEIIIYDTDSNYDYERMKIGDGVTNINDLPFSHSLNEIDLISYFPSATCSDLSVSEEGIKWIDTERYFDSNNEIIAHGIDHCMRIPLAAGTGINLSYDDTYSVIRINANSDIETLANTTWHMNDTIYFNNLSGYYDIDFAFTTLNGGSSISDFNGLAFNEVEGHDQLLMAGGPYGSYFWCYDADNYGYASNSTVDTLTITGGDDVQNQELINWFLANGKNESTNEIDLSEYQTKNDNNLKTQNKDIVNAINEINDKTTDKIKEIEMMGGHLSTISYLDYNTDEGIVWTDTFKFFGSQTTPFGEGGETTQRIPLIAGNNIEFELNGGAIKINAKNNNVPTGRIDDLSDTVWEMNSQWTNLDSTQQWELNFGYTINEGSSTWDEESYIAFEVTPSSAWVNNGGSDWYQVAGDYDLDGTTIEANITEFRIDSYGGPSSKDNTLINWFYNNGTLVYKGSGSSGDMITDLSNTVWSMKDTWTTMSTYWDLNFICLIEGSGGTNPTAEFSYLEMTGYEILAGMVYGSSDYYTLGSNENGSDPYTNYGVKEFQIMEDGGSSATDTNLINWFYTNGTLISGSQPSAGGIVPMPTVDDEGKFLRVNASGMPEWMTVLNAENNLF